MKKSKITVFQTRLCTFLLSITAAFLLLGCNPRYGFVESTFQLAPESRFPRWFHVSDYQRKDFTMIITIYSSPLSGSTAKMTVYGPPPERKKLMEKAGKERWHPLSEKEHDNKYPNYTIITVDGIEEVFEQKQAGDILYITDDPKLRRSN